MSILALDYQDKTEQREVYRLIQDYKKDINKQIQRVILIEKELNKGNITLSRHQDLVLATRLIAKDLDYKAFPCKSTVQNKIEKIYQASFNSREVQLKQAVVELKRCSKLILDYHRYYIQSPWGNGYLHKCRKQGKNPDLAIEKLLNLKQQVKLKQIEFSILMKRQVLVEEKDYLLNIANKISKLAGVDIETGLKEIISKLDTTISLKSNKKQSDKETIQEVYKYLYISIRKTVKEREELL